MLPRVKACSERNATRNAAPRQARREDQPQSMAKPEQAPRSATIRWCSMMHFVYCTPLAFSRFH